MEEGVFFGPKNATPSQVVIKVRTGAEKRSFFGSLKQNLLLREGIESNPGPVTIGETLACTKTVVQMESWRNQKSKLKVSSFSNFQETTLGKGSNNQNGNLRCFFFHEGGGLQFHICNYSIFLKTI